MSLLYAILTFKFAFVCLTFILPSLGRFLLTKIYYLTLNKNNIQYKTFIAIIELKYILIYITHTYILYLWLYAIGNDRNLLQRFKIIYGCSVFVYVCSIFYRWAILIFPVNAWLLVFCILLFGINALFRVSLPIGALADYLVKMDLLEDTPKKSNILLEAEKFEQELKFSFFSFGYHSMGQIIVLKNFGRLPVFPESFMRLNKKTMFIADKYTYFGLYCICIVAFISFLLA